MVRKVKAYLADLFIVDNESELDRMSCECEAPAAGSSHANSSFTSSHSAGLYIFNDCPTILTTLTFSSIFL